MKPLDLEVAIQRLRIDRRFMVNQGELQDQLTQELTRLLTAQADGLKPDANGQIHIDQIVLPMDARTPTADVGRQAAAQVHQTLTGGKG